MLRVARAVKSGKPSPAKLSSVTKLSHPWMSSDVNDRESGLSAGNSVSERSPHSLSDMSRLVKAVNPVARASNPTDVTGGAFVAVSCADKQRVLRVVRVPMACRAEFVPRQQRPRLRDVNEAKFRLVSVASCAKCGKSDAGKGHHRRQFSPESFTRPFGSPKWNALSAFTVSSVSDEGR
eukprot:scaffold3097_cov31-Prasinocladus_malaysianus.AAC.2